MSVSVDVGVMWRLSEDLNRRFGLRMQPAPPATHHPHHHTAVHHYHHQHHHHGHAAGSAHSGHSSMIFNGKNIWHFRTRTAIRIEIPKLNRSRGSKFQSLACSLTRYRQLPRSRFLSLFARVSWRNCLLLTMSHLELCCFRAADNILIWGELSVYPRQIANWYKLVRSST